MGSKDNNGPIPLSFLLGEIKHYEPFGGVPFQVKENQTKNDHFGGSPQKRHTQLPCKEVKLVSGTADSKSRLWTGMLRTRTHTNPRLGPIGDHVGNRWVSLMRNKALTSGTVLFLAKPNLDFHLLEAPGKQKNISSVIDSLQNQQGKIAHVLKQMDVEGHLWGCPFFLANRFAPTPLGGRSCWAKTGHPGVRGHTTVRRRRRQRHGKKPAAQTTAPNQIDNTFGGEKQGTQKNVYQQVDGSFALSNPHK